MDNTSLDSALAELQNGLTSKGATATASRLPAGSVLRLPNGVTVPHPHAEVNLPGAADGRVGQDAVIETVRIETVEMAEEPQPETVVTTTLIQGPLSDEVKPKVLVKG